MRGLFKIKGLQQLKVHSGFYATISLAAVGRLRLSINFVPERGRILVCNFDMARVHPENAKIRRAAVVATRSYNERHGAGPGRCIVVPFSATQPPALKPSDIFFAAGPYRALTMDTWANCDSVMAVSHARLDRVRIRFGAWSEELLTADDLKRLEGGLRHAFGCPLDTD